MCTIMGRMLSYIKVHGYHPCSILHEYYEITVYTIYIILVFLLLMYEADQTRSVLAGIPTIQGEFGRPG